MGRQKIVKGASGYAMPGTTLYIMGSSGAGKTSLLKRYAFNDYSADEERTIGSDFYTK